MKERSNGQNTAAVILIGIGVLFLAGQVLGFSVFDAIGAVFGVIGGTIGTIFGTLGSALGTIFGGIGSLIGSVFDAIGNITNLGWPYFIILPGLAVLAAAFFGPASIAPLATVGSVITGTGLILLYQDATGRFETWAYLWALYPAFVGASLMFVGARTGNRSMTEGGRRAIITGLLMTAGFGLFFELIFSGGADLLFQYGIPLALIVAGYLLLRKRNTAPALEKSKHELAYAAPLLEKPKNTGKYGIHPDLERQINDALAEDDDAPVL